MTHHSTLLRISPCLVWLRLQPRTETSSLSLKILLVSGSKRRWSESLKIWPQCMTLTTKNRIHTTVLTLKGKTSLSPPSSARTTILPPLRQLTPRVKRLSLTSAANRLKFSQTDRPNFRSTSTYLTNYRATQGQAPITSKIRLAWELRKVRCCLSRSHLQGRMVNLVISSRGEASWKRPTNRIWRSMTRRSGLWKDFER